MVAKSYQELPLLGEPFEKSGRMYIDVQLKSGKSKAVRWYTEKEYAKIYPAERETPIGRTYGPQKKILGFSKGYITIFKGADLNNQEQREWFKSIGCTERIWWDWGLPSDKELPEELPFPVTPLRLDWDMVGDEDGYIRSDEAARQAVKKLLRANSFSLPVGTKIEKELTVIDSQIHENSYGEYYFHIFLDSDNNRYAWSTKARHWGVGDRYLVKGAVKSNEEDYVLLTRCKGELI